MIFIFRIKLSNLQNYLTLLPKYWSNFKGDVCRGAYNPLNIEIGENYLTPFHPSDKTLCTPMHSYTHKSFYSIYFKAKIFFSILEIDLLFIHLFIYYFNLSNTWTTRPEALIFNLLKSISHFIFKCSKF